MNHLTSPTSEYGPMSEEVSAAEKTPLAENSAEGSLFHEQRPSRNRPCDACRRRKSRCVLNDGAIKCVLCKFHAQECTFTDKIAPRKRRFTSCEDDLDRPYLDAAKRRLSERSGGASKSQDVAVEDYADLKGPTLLKRTLGLQRRHHGIYVGSSGKFERLLTTREPIGANVKKLTDLSFRHVSDHDVFVIHPDSGTEMYDDEIEDLDAIENTVAPHGRALVDLYFRIIHPSFPILHKRVYLEKYERSHREFSPALLAAVYILATTYWAYSPELSLSSVPNVAHLEKLALKALNYAVHRPKLSTVEAGLLLLQRSSRASWSLTAQMVAVGQDLGLHRNCSSWDIPSWEKGLRKRLAWALFMQDKWASLIHGRPSHITACDWAVSTLNDQDFPESFADEDDEDGSTEVVQGRSLFTSMTSLTQILSEILLKLYSGTAEDETVRKTTNATTHILAKAKPLQIRLKEWHSHLPESLSVSHVRVRKLSSSGSLHLAYWATEITLHRCIAATLPHCPDTHLVSICHGAATLRSKSAMEFVNRLRSEHWQSFWYFASDFNFGLIGVFEKLVSSIRCSSSSSSNSSSSGAVQDARESVSRLDQYRWSLKMASQSASFLEKSIGMVNTASAEQGRKERRSDLHPDPGEVDEGKRESVKESETEVSLEEEFERAQWAPSHAQAAMYGYQTDYDQVSWGQDAFFDTGLAIDP